MLEVQCTRTSRGCKGIVMDIMFTVEGGGGRLHFQWNRRYWHISVFPKCFRWIRNPLPLVWETELLPLCQEDKGNKDLWIAPYLCFSDLSDSLNLLNSMKNRLHLEKYSSTKDAIQYTFCDLWSAGSWIFFAFAIAIAQCKRALKQLRVACRQFTSKQCEYLWKNKIGNKIIKINLCIVLVPKVSTSCKLLMVINKKKKQHAIDLIFMLKSCPLLPMEQKFQIDNIYLPVMPFLSNLDFNSLHRLPHSVAYWIDFFCRKTFTTNDI